ncbi:hypothetical protein FKP32DRAFT_1373927 [Trametes sanguinea]|nr:hypothetical protein FKP32DRAFT_1373927 [Trametes sanguinea]
MVIVSGLLISVSLCLGAELFCVHYACYTCEIYLGCLDSHTDAFTYQVFLQSGLLRPGYNVLRLPTRALCVHAVNIRFAEAEACADTARVIGAYSHTARMMASRTRCPILPSSSLF